MHTNSLHSNVKLIISVFFVPLVWMNYGKWFFPLKWNRNLANSANIICWCPLESWQPHLREILDLTLILKILSITCVLLIWWLPYPEIGDTSLRCALWTFKQKLTFKMQIRCGISIVFQYCCTVTFRMRSLTLTQDFVTEFQLIQSQHVMKTQINSVWNWNYRSGTVNLKSFVSKV